MDLQHTQDYLHFFISTALSNEKVISKLDGTEVHLYSFRRGDVHYEFEIMSFGDKEGNQVNETRVVSDNKLIVDWQATPEEAYIALIEYNAEKSSELRGVFHYLLSLLKRKDKNIDGEF